MHTIFADYASRVGSLGKVVAEFDNLSTSEKFDKMCAIWTEAGCADLVEYYANKAQESNRFRINSREEVLNLASV